MTQKKGPSFKQPATVQNIASVLDQLNITSRFNLMTRKIEHTLPPAAETMINKVGRNDLLVGSIIENMLHFAAINDSKKIFECLESIATLNTYHPAYEYFKALPKPRNKIAIAKGPIVPRGEFKKLIDNAIVFENAHEKKVGASYLYRTCIQAVEASCGWAKPRLSQKAHVLLFIGPQGCGKTSFIQYLFPDDPRTEGFVKTGVSLHLDSFSARDSAHIALTHVIVEMGEIEYTFRKSDYGAMKNFISRIEDSYRLPYAKIEITYPRCTIFIGTANGLDVLNDPTGARRYAPVRVKWMHNPREHVDLAKMWAEFYQLWLQEESWFLTPEEEAFKGAREMDFTSSDEITDKLNMYFGERFKTTDPKTWTPVNFSYLAEILNIKATPVTGPKVRQWFLKTHGIERLSRYSDTKRGFSVQLCWLVPLYPEHVKWVHDKFRK